MTALYLLTADVAAAVLICPAVLAGLSTTVRWARTLAIVGLWLVVSAVTLAVLGTDLATVAVSHLVLATIALATSSIGRALRCLFTDPLDAIATAVCVCVVFSFGIFAAGRFAGELSPDLLTVVLAANPFVAIAAAAKIDIFHSELLYRTSPLPHLLFEYPAWQMSAGVFAAVTVVCGSVAGRARRPVSTVTSHG